MRGSGPIDTGNHHDRHGRMRLSQLSHQIEAGKFDGAMNDDRALSFAAGKLDRGFSALTFVNDGARKFPQEGFYQEKSRIGIIIDDQERRRVRHVGYEFVLPTHVDTSATRIA